MQATGVHEKTMELLTQIARKVFGSISPKKIVELFHLGEVSTEGRGLRLGISAKDIVDAFFGSPGFPRLLSADIVVRAIVAGVSALPPQFAYWGQGEPELGGDGRYNIPRERVLFGRIIQEDEVDLEKGFLICPDALPTMMQKGPIGQPPEPPPTSAPPEGSEITQVTYQIEADRDQLFKAWSPLANLAEMTGKIVLTIEAKTDRKLDPNKLRNAVEEPLEELKILRKKIERNNYKQTGLP